MRDLAWILGFGLAGGVAAGAPAPCRLRFLVPVEAGEGLPAFEPAPAPRATAAGAQADQEAGRLIRSLLALAMGEPGEGDCEPDLGDLLVGLNPGGNYARLGLRVKEAGRLVEHAARPWIELAETEKALTITFLHEGAHVAHRLADGCRPAGGDGWTPLPHSTFAVTDRRTALAEGYAIHLEAMWGHFGSHPARMAFYRRTAPAFGPEAGGEAAAFFPVRDQWSYSQDWARYQAVRDGVACFQGVAWPGDPLRAQLSPERDLARLKTPGQMLASEGVVASVLFWCAARRAMEAGAKPGAGLDQPGVLEAELWIWKALKAACKAARIGPLRKDELRPQPDLLDLVGGLGTVEPGRAGEALGVFVELTRGVTASGEVAGLWERLHGASVALDPGALPGVVARLTELRAEARRAGLDSLGSLRRCLGPVLPVRVPRATYAVPLFGEPFPLEFDLNAAGEAEWAALPGLGLAARIRLKRALAEGPFRSLAEFAARTGSGPAAFGLVPATP